MFRSFAAAAPVMTSSIARRSMFTLSSSSIRPSSLASASSSSSPSSASACHRTACRCMSVHAVQSEVDMRTLLDASSSKLVIVDWTASWCGPCKQIAPIYSSLSDEHPGVVFIKADIDVLSDASVEAGVQSVPTFHFIKGGELVGEFAGADQNKLRAMIKQFA